MRFNLNKKSLLFASILLVIQCNVYSIPAFVDEIPNGNQNTCLNCHFSLTGGRLTLNNF